MQCFQILKKQFLGNVKKHHADDAKKIINRLDCVAVNLLKFATNCVKKALLLDLLTK